MDSEFFFGAQRMRSTCLEAPREVTSASVLYYRQSQSVFLFLTLCFVLFFHSSSIYLPSCDPKGSGNCVTLEIPMETYSDSIVECNYKKEKGRRENGLVDNLWKDLMGSMIMEKDLGV